MFLRLLSFLSCHAQERDWPDNNMMHRGCVIVLEPVHLSPCGNVSSPQTKFLANAFCSSKKIIQKTEVQPQAFSTLNFLCTLLIKMNASYPSFKVQCLFCSCKVNDVFVMWIDNLLTLEFLPLQIKRDDFQVTCRSSRRWGGGLAPGAVWPEGGFHGGRGRGHFGPTAIYCITTWCFALKRLRTMNEWIREWVNIPWFPPCSKLRVKSFHPTITRVETAHGEFWICTNGHIPRLNCPVDISRQVTVMKRARFTNIALHHHPSLIYNCASLELCLSNTVWMKWEN